MHSRICIIIIFTLEFICNIYFSSSDFPGAHPGKGEANNYSKEIVIVIIIIIVPRQQHLYQGAVEGLNSFPTSFSSRFRMIQAGIL